MTSSRVGRDNDKGLIDVHLLADWPGAKAGEPA